jgi:ice-binding like protein
MEYSPVSTRSVDRSRPKRWAVVLGLVVVTGLLVAVGLISVSSRASAAEAPIGLGTAATYSVLGGQAVTNTGPSVLADNVGVSPGTAITGFPPGISNGDTHAGDAHAAGAQADLTTAYNDAAGRAPTANIAGDLGGLTLTTGVYKASSSIGLTGALTLDAEGDPNAVFIFQVGSALTTASASSINMINGAQPCNVYWQVGSSATLGTTSTFKGTILALTSISVTTGTNVEGRALARNGQVSLDTNVFTEPGCETTTPTTTTTTDETTTTTTTDTTTTTTDDTDTVTSTNSTTSTTTNSTAPGAGTSVIGGGMPGGKGNDYPSGPDDLAYTGSSSALIPLFAIGSSLVILGSLLFLVVRARTHGRKRPPTT